MGVAFFKLVGCGAVANSSSSSLEVSVSLLEGGLCALLVGASCSSSSLEVSGSSLGGDGWALLVVCDEFGG